MNSGSLHGLSLLAAGGTVEERRPASLGADDRDRTQAGAFFAFTAPELPYDRHDPEQQKRLLGNAFSGLGWEVPRLLASPHQTPDLHFRPCNPSPDPDVMSA